MVSAETLLNYPDWTIPFTIHTDASDKQLGAVISQNDKPIAFFCRRLSKVQLLGMWNKDKFDEIDRVIVWNM